MNERRENSVLFSLKELRRLEDDRVRKEDDDNKARLEAERAAKEAAEQRSRDEAERVRLAAEAEARRVQNEREAEAREGQLRVQEAERRHRVDAEMKLHQERLHLEMQHKAKNSPVKAVVSVAAVLVLIGGGVTYKMYSQHQAELAVERAERARVEAEKAKVEAEKAKAEQAYKAELASINAETERKLASAHSAEERERIKAQDATARAQANARHGGSHSASAKTEETPVKNKLGVPGKHTISDNPLEGLNDGKF
jgi:hypothetical protein